MSKELAYAPAGLQAVSGSRLSHPARQHAVYRHELATNPAATALERSHTGPIPKATIGDNNRAEPGRLLSCHSPGRIESYCFLR
jgi:hypothetical protein